MVRNARACLCDIFSYELGSSRSTFEEIHAGNPSRCTDEKSLAWLRVRKSETRSLNWNVQGCLLNQARIDQRLDLELGVSYEGRGLDGDAGLLLGLRHRRVHVAGIHIQSVWSVQTSKGCSTVAFVFVNLLLLRPLLQTHLQHVCQHQVYVLKLIQNLKRRIDFRFDYGFNMLLNVSVGIVNAICWLVWSRQHWQERPYVKKAAISVTLLALTVGLELMDFVPIFWTFDAHSLWHASTVGINYFWYSFITNDCKYLMITEGAEVRKRV